MVDNLTRHPGYYRDLLENICNESRNYNDVSISCEISTEIVRKTHDDEIHIDIYITYDASLASKGYKATYDDPGCAPEWEFDITDIEMDLPSAQNNARAIMELGGPLTTKEKSKIVDWFEANHAKAAEIANDRYAVD